MAQPIAPDYGQQFLFPPALEEGVRPDHPARFLREFVDQLDRPKLGFALPVAVEGRPPYYPSLLLKIWIFIASVRPGNWRPPAPNIFRCCG